MGFRPLSCLVSSSNSNRNEENTSVKQMTYLELDKATQSFHESNFLGCCSFGRVYKGILENKMEHRKLVRTQFSRSDQFDAEMKFLGRLQHPNIVKLLGYCKTEPEALMVYEFMPRRSLKENLSGKEVVAVKEHSELVRTQLQRSDQFDAEMKFLSCLQHPNIVKLLGYCKTEPKALLVYEFMPRRSLKENLSGLKPPSVVLDWNTRMRIAVGVAEGLSFLHSTKSVIHGDLKESVILLDDDYTPKISGFGMARSADTGNGDCSKNSRRGFERLRRSIDSRFQSSKSQGVTKKTDVHEFGAILFQLLSGRDRFLKVNGGYKSICSWAHELLADKESHLKLVDPLLYGNFPLEGLVAVGRLARCCTDLDSTICPSMELVLSRLKALVEQHSDSSKSHYQEESSSRPLSGENQSASTMEEDEVIALAKEDLEIAEEVMNASTLTIEAVTKTIAAAEERIAAARKTEEAARKTEKAAVCTAEAAHARIVAAERKVKGQSRTIANNRREDCPK